MSFKAKVAGIFGAFVLTAGSIAGAAAATSTTADVQVDVQANGGSVNVTIAGYSQTKQAKYNQTQTDTSTGNFAVTVTDTRGTGQGWSVKIKTGGQFVDTADSSKTFTPAKFEIGTNGSSIAADANKGNIQGVYAGDVNANATSTILTAQKGNGMGTTTYSNVPATITVPANTLVGTYKSTLVVEVSQDPQ